jgi:DNA-binding response OmpR family regulator
VGLFRKKEAAAAPAAPAPAAPRNRRVLIVDDDMTIAELNQTVFVGRPWDVETAYNGTGALAAVNGSKPDLVLLDLMLPDIPGERVLDSIRSLRVATKVIVVTGRYVTQKDFEPYTGTVVWVLRKPYAMSDLKELVQWFESGREMAPKLSQVGDV